MCGVAVSLLDVAADEASAALGEEDKQALMKSFAEDKDVPVLLIVGMYTYTHTYQQ